ncbi:hypothetical protein MY11210_005925 [Beauveria gryllotalpidicola]
MATPSQEPPAEADFGPIPATKENVESLRALTHSHPRLQKAGYVLWQLGQSDLDKKKRCERCTKVIRKGRERQKARAESVKVAPGVAQQIAADAYPRPGRGPGQASVPAHTRSMSTQAGPRAADMADMMRDMKLETPDGKNPSPPMDCRYHPGRIQSRLWTCCGRSIAGAPCAAEQSHTTRVYRRDELERNWAYFPTPPASSSQDHVAAVALDCEMGTAASGESELIRVSAVDLFTRRVLVDSLVWPDVRMAHYNTRFSGVSRPAMDAARQAGRALAGRAAAREALWRFVGPKTVVVGHSANSDLNALRWIHPLVVDTLLLEMRIQERPQSRNEECGQEEEGEQQQQQQAVVDKEDKAKYPGLSLKALAKERLKREIQNKAQGHDSLEDALATRDLCLWHMVNKPEPPISF